MQTACVQRGKLGSTEYFLGKMPAGQLIDTVGLAAEMPEWERGAVVAAETLSLRSKQKQFKRKRSTVM